MAGSGESSVGSSMRTLAVPGSIGLSAPSSAVGHIVAGEHVLCVVELVEQDFTSFSTALNLNTADHTGVNHLRDLELGSSAGQSLLKQSQPFTSSNRADVVDVGGCRCVAVGAWLSLGGHVVGLK